MIEYDLSGLELESDEEKAEAEDASELEESGDWDLSSEFDEGSEESSVAEKELGESEEDLSLDLEEGDLADSDLSEEQSTTEPEASTEELAESDAEADIDSLDESFLDELDAELDKVAGEEDELGGSEIEESSLDDLELDVSDEDLALMEEFSDTADSANPEETEEASLDEELGLEDALGEGDADEANPEQSVEGAEELEQQASPRNWKNPTLRQVTRQLRKKIWICRWLPMKFLMDRVKHRPLILKKASSVTKMTLISSQAPTKRPPNSILHGHTSRWAMLTEPAISLRKSHWKETKIRKRRRRTSLKICPDSL